MSVSSFGLLLLSIYLILIGASQLGILAIDAVILGLLALIAGILLLFASVSGFFPARRD